MGLKVVLRHISAKSPNALEEQLSMFPVRIQILGAPVWDGKVWTVWYLLEDRNKNVKGK